MSRVSGKGNVNAVTTKVLQRVYRSQDSNPGDFDFNESDAQRNSLYADWHRAVQRSDVRETTALGTGCLAGIRVGFWENPNDIADLWRPDKHLQPHMTDSQRASLQTDWHRAVQRASAWVRG